MDSDPAATHRASLTAFAVPNLMSLFKVSEIDDATRLATTLVLTTGTRVVELDELTSDRLG